MMFKCQSRDFSLIHFGESRDRSAARREYSLERAEALGEARVRAASRSETALSSRVG